MSCGQQKGHHVVRAWYLNNKIELKETSMWDYSEKVKEHFLHPKNVGEIKNPDAEATVGNITCGDALKLMLRIDKNGIIQDAKFQTFGCASAIASSSALTEMIIGKSVVEAEALSNKDIAAFLGGLPEEKMHCSVMGKEALEKALKLYRGEAVTEAHEDDHGKIVCRCFGVTDTLIRRVIRENKLTTIDEVTHYCKAGGGCTSCHNDIQLIIDEEMKQTRSVGSVTESARAAHYSAMTNIQKIALIQQTIVREVAPHLRQDGGDIELIDVIGDTVVVALRGACSGCPSAGYTLKLAVEAKLQELVSPTIMVEEKK